MSIISDAQDGYGQLVEECRLWTVFACDMTGPTTRYYQHNPHIDLSDVPIFFGGEYPEQFISEPMIEALEAIVDGKWRTPYPRCAFYYHIPADHRSLRRANDIAGQQHGLSREYVMVVEEEEDESVLIYGFLRHKEMKHWAKQAWQVVIKDGDFHWAYDPVNGSTNPEFVENYVMANAQRVTYLVSQIYQIVNGQGTMTHAEGGTHSARVDTRRAKAKLPPIPRVRVIDFSKVRVSRPVKNPGTGSPKSPHFRHGAYRNLSTGRRVWVRASAIHGGTPNAPPWYEIVDKKEKK